MSDGFWARALLRCYPQAWRRRYGEELAALIAESGAAGSWRGRLDIARAGGRESLRELGVAARDGSPGEQARSGAVLVLCAWSLFVVAGAGVQKVSEHWQDVTPESARAVPGAAFTTLVLAAGLGAVLVVVGVGIALPALYAYLRAGGWPTLRRPVVRAVRLTLVTVPLTAAIVAWAHRLNDAQRTGGDTRYSLAVLVWLCFVVGCLAAWTAAAARTSRELRWPLAVLRAEARLAAAATVAMAVMTIATTVWWAALAASAPSSVAGGASPPLLTATLLMVAATAAGTVGTVRAQRALRRSRA